MFRQPQSKVSIMFRIIRSRSIELSKNQPCLPHRPGKTRKSKFLVVTLLLRLHLTLVSFREELERTNVTHVSICKY